MTFFARDKLQVNNGKSLDEWPETCFEPKDVLSHATFDDEGAVKVFSCVTWRDVNLDDLIKHPTSLWFLSDKAFAAFIPAVLLAIQYGLQAKQSLSGGALLLDHFESNLHRRFAAVETLVPSGFSLTDVSSTIEKIRQNAEKNMVTFTDPS